MEWGPESRSAIARLTVIKVANPFTMTSCVTEASPQKKKERHMLSCPPKRRLSSDIPMPSRCLKVEGSPRGGSLQEAYPVFCTKGSSCLLLRCLTPNASTKPCGNMSLPMILDNESRWSCLQLASTRGAIQRLPTKRGQIPDKRSSGVWRSLSGAVAHA